MRPCDDTLTTEMKCDLFIFFDSALPGYAILSFVLGIAVVIMAIISFFGYRHYKLEAEIHSMAWKVNWADVLPCNTTNKARGSIYSLAKRGSQLVSCELDAIDLICHRIIVRHFLCSQTVCSEEMGSLAGDKQQFIPLGFYKGCKVAIKQINQKNIHLNRALMLELKKVRKIYDFDPKYRMHSNTSRSHFTDERHSSWAFGEILWRMRWPTESLHTDWILSEGIASRYSGKWTNQIRLDVQNIADAWHSSGKWARLGCLLHQCIWNLMDFCCCRSYRACTTCIRPTYVLMAIWNHQIALSTHALCWKLPTLDCTVCESRTTTKTRNTRIVTPTGKVWLSLGLAWVNTEHECMNFESVS